MLSPREGVAWVVRVVPPMLVTCVTSLYISDSLRVVVVRSGVISVTADMARDVKMVSLSMSCDVTSSSVVMVKLILVEDDRPA